MATATGRGAQMRLAMPEFVIGGANHTGAVAHGLVGLDVTNRTIGFRLPRLMHMALEALFVFGEGGASRIGADVVTIITTGFRVASRQFAAIHVGLVRKADESGHLAAANAELCGGVRVGQQIAFIHAVGSGRDRRILVTAGAKSVALRRSRLFESVLFAVNRVAAITGVVVGLPVFFIGLIGHGSSRFALVALVAIAAVGQLFMPIAEVVKARFRTGNLVIDYLHKARL